MELGIDFGTTFSTVCFSPASGIAGCVEESESIYIPTVVAIRPDNSFSIGRAALAETSVHLYRDIKRWVGCSYINEHIYRAKLKPSYKVVVDKYECSIAPVNDVNGPLRKVVDLITLFIKGCVAILQKSIPESIAFCTCSVPAEYNSFKRGYVYTACQSLNIGVQAVVNEPTAAAFSLMNSNSSTDLEYLTVYDFGGGTFDCSLILKSPGYMTVIDSLGDNYLGGRDVDVALVNLVASKLKISPSEISSFQMENIKITLSSRADISHFDIVSLSKDRYEVDISQAEFKDLTYPLINKAVKLVSKILNRNNVKSTLMVLIGGSCTLPGTREQLLTLSSVKGFIFSHETYRAAVAIGAAKYAATFSGNNRFRLIDCVAASLSDDRVPYEAKVIIPKGHPTPCSITSSYEMPNFETALTLHEGESPNVLLNERCFSAILSPSQFKSRETGDLVISVSEDGRVSATYKGIALKNSVVIQPPTSFPQQARYETLIERLFEPSVRKYQDAFGQYSKVLSFSSKSLREREDLYKTHGYVGD